MSRRFLLRKFLEAKEHGRKFFVNQKAQPLVVNSRYISHEPYFYNEGNYGKHMPSLLKPLAGLKSPPCLSGSMQRNPTEITTLPNGLKIASEAAMGPAACIGIFVDSGSVYETQETVGATHLLEKLAFKSTKNRSHLRVVQDVEATGGNIGVSSSREQMAYSYDTLKAYLPAAVEILIDCIRNPIFLDVEVDEQLARVKYEIGDHMADPQQYIIEALHLTGFTGGLGNPLVAPEAALERINGPLISKFYHENYTADRMVLAAYGVDHEELLAIAKPLLHDLERGLPLKVPKSNYSGGDFRKKVDTEKKTHVALAFEVPGGWREEKDATILTVLQTLMGGGGSFSAGGPGKGMNSRLYLRVLNEYKEVQSFIAFSSLFNDTGLFGIHSITESDFVEKAVNIAASELIAVATPGEVTELELLRAKNATKSAILMNLESRAIVTEDIGRQILTYESRKTVDHFLSLLDSLTLDDITLMSQKLLSSPLTMASCGDVDKVPSYDSVSRLFRD